MKTASDSKSKPFKETSDLYLDLHHLLFRPPSRSRTIERNHSYCKSTTSSPGHGVDGWEIVTTSNSVSPVANEEPATAAVPKEKLPTLYKVKALFTFDSARSDDLPFSEGDVLWVEKDDGGNWVYGSKEGDPNNSGYFPKNYVEELKSKAESPIRLSIPPRDYEGYAEALYSYEASQGDEGTVTAGEVVGILTKSEANWWKIESMAGQGLVPATYLRELDLEEGKSRPSGLKK
ncbi:SH3 domain-containing protein [Cladochytrium replicatum]|nr:SH3 domain-containing protein [Cladochytrium replicatum]